MADNEWITVTDEDEWKTIPEGGFRGAGTTGEWRPEPTPVEEVGQVYKETVAAPVRTVESMLGSMGGLMRMGVESAAIGTTLTKFNADIPGAGIIAEHLIRKYGPKKALSFYDRKMKKFADSGKKISDFWSEQANKGWEAPNPDIVEAEWYDPRHLTSVISSGLTSIGVVVGTTFLTKSPVPGLALLSASETGSMYDRLRNKDVPPEIASKLAQAAGAWTYVTEKIGFEHLLKPGPNTFVNFLKKGGYEGWQEVIEQVGHNLLEYFGYDYRKPQDIPTAVKAAYDHTMDGWVDALVGGVGAGGLTHVMLPGQHVAEIKALDDVWANVEQRTDVTPQQKEQALRYIGDIETRIEERIVNKFPERIDSQESLERVGNQIAEELGIKGITWNWNTEKIRRKYIAFYRPSEKSITFNVNRLITPMWTADVGAHKIGRGVYRTILNKTPGDLNQNLIKQVLIHELGHNVVPEIGKRIYHTKDFFDWVNTNVKNLFEGVEQQTLPIERPEAIGPLAIPPTVEEITGKSIREIETEPEINKLSEKYFPEEKEIVPETIRSAAYYNPNTGEVSEGSTHLQAAVNMKEMYPTIEEGKPTPKLIQEGFVTSLGRFITNKEAELIAKKAGQIPKNYRLTQEERILGRPTAQNILAKQKKSAEPTEIGMSAEIKRTKRRLLALAHKIKRDAGLTDEEYRDFAEGITGKRSMVQMSPTERNEFVLALEESYGTPKTLTPEDYQKPIPFMGKTTTMSNIILDIAKMVDELPPTTTIPQRVKQRIFGAGIKEALIKGKANLIGIDTSRPQRLAKILSGFKDSTLTKLFREELIERGSNTKTTHQAAFYQSFQNFIKEQGVTSDQLAKFSRSQNRWWAPVEAIRELTGYGPDIKTIEFNKRQYEQTWDSLLKLYMQVRQPKGWKHVNLYGFVINKVHTGPVSDVELNNLKTLVESNPLSKQLITYWDEKAEIYYWKPPVNQTSQILEGKDIATEKQWYPFDVERVEKAGKKTGFAFKLEKSRINLIEDKTILNPRRGPVGALLDGSFLEDMYDTEEGVADYISYAVPLRIARTVLAHRGIVDTWRKKGYTNIYDNLLTIINNETRLPDPKGWFETVVLRLTRGAVRGLLDWNLRTSAIQVSSTAMLRKDFDSKYILIGLKNASTSSMDKFLQDVPWAWCRYYLDRGPRQVAGIAETAGLTLPMQGKLSAGQAIGVLLKKSDLKPFHVIYEAAKAEYHDAHLGKLEPGSLASQYWQNKNTSFDENTEDALRMIRERFTVGKRGQQSYDKFDRSTQTSSKTTISKIFYLFRSFHEGALNALQESVDDWQHSKKNIYDAKVLARKTGAVASSYFIEQILRDSVSWVMAGIISQIARAFGMGGRPPEKEKWYNWPVRIILGPLDLIPLVGNALQTYLKNFVRILGHQKPLYAGRIAEPLPLQILNTISEAPDNFAQAIAFFLTGQVDKGKKSLGASIGKLYEGIALPSGVPVYEIERVRKIIESEEPEREPGPARRQGGSSPAGRQ